MLSQQIPLSIKQDTYIIVDSENSDNLKNQTDFEDNSFPIRDKKGVSMFGNDAYFVRKDWLEKENLFGSDV